MKKFKPAYGMAVIFSFIQIYYYFAIAMIPAVIIMSIKAGEKVWNNLFNLLMITIIMIILFCIIPIIINLISKIFSKEHVKIEDDVLYYKGDKINLREVKKLSWYLGEMSRSSVSACALCIIMNDGDFLTINRPSIILIHYLKRKCVNAKLSVQNILKKALIYPGLCFILGIIFGIILLIVK